MSEITKLYENAGVKPLCQIPDMSCGVKNVYEDLTAEKQIEILKLILKKRRILDVGYIIEEGKYHCMHYERVFDSFEEALCADVNYHWRDLTEEEKTSIKNILEAENIL